LKLSDIRTAFEKLLSAQPPQEYEEMTTHIQTLWDDLPRAPYNELPASLKKNVRETVTLESLRAFLSDCYTPATFDTLIAGIPESDMQRILLRTRNTAVYTIDAENFTFTYCPGKRKYGVIQFSDDYTPTMDVNELKYRANLYGNHATAAFDAALQQYRKPAHVDNSKPADDAGAPPVSVLQEIQQPDEITFPKDLVYQKLFNNELTPGVTGRVTGKNRHEITVTDKAGKKMKAPIAPIVTVSLLDLPPNIQITREMTSDDDSVFRAVCSLWAAGTSRFTGNAIYAAMIGNPDAKATPEWLATIDECWTRQTSTQIELDTGTVGDAYNFKRWKRNRRVIEGGKDTVTIGNQFGQTATTVYTMLEEPLLQTYANAINQIARFPRAVLNTPVNKTPETLALQNFLIFRICSIPRISNHILYETIWEKMHLQGNAPAIERRKEKMRSHIRKMLAHWVKVKFITRWKEVKQGNTLHHIEIAIPATKELPPAEQTPEKTGGNPGKNGG